MRLAHVDGRLTVVLEDGVGIDVARASDGRFGPDPMTAFADWSAFRAWADVALPGTVADVRFTVDELGAPVPRPAQVFAIGLNYRAHAAETGAPVPDRPVVFTKFSSCLTGPSTVVVLSPGDVDWEAELVVVVGAVARDVAEDDAWSYVAGVMVGNDVSDRAVQMSDPARQWCLGKSFPGYGPTGPWLVTPDELDDPDDLAIGCEVDGVTVQESRTSDLIFPVATLVSTLSRSVTLLPGDLIWTGTPSGVALGREDRPFLRPGARMRTWVEGVGELHQRFVGVG